MFKLFSISLLFILIAAVHSNDPRFGLIGDGGAAFSTSFNIKWYAIEGNQFQTSAGIFYASSSLPAAENKKVVREAAKLNHRLDGKGLNNEVYQEYLTYFTLVRILWPTLIAPIRSYIRDNLELRCQQEQLECVSNSQNVKFAHYGDIIDPDEIFDAEIEHIHNAIDNGMTGQTWEIGNEPNFFPNIKPEAYAEIFDKYYNSIKNKDPSAKIVLGALFVTELVKEDYFQKFLEGAIAELEKLGYGNSNAYIESCIRETYDLISTRTYKYTTAEYLQKTMDNITVSPDMISIHVHPYDYDNDQNDIALLNSVIDEIHAIIDKPIWITEFGNIENLKPEQETASDIKSLVKYFKTKSEVEKWFYYKAVGQDHVDPNPALTSLIKPEYWDKTIFTKTDLNAIGEVIYKESRYSIVPTIVKRYYLN